MNEIDTLITKINTYPQNCIRKIEDIYSLAIKFSDFNHEESKKWSLIGLELSKEIKNEQLKFGFIHRLSIYYRNKFEFKESTRLLKLCLEYSKRKSNLVDYAIVIESIGINYIEICEYKKAIKCFQKANDIYTDYRYKGLLDNIIRLNVNLINAYTLSKNYSEADSHIHELFTLYKSRELVHDKRYAQLCYYYAQNLHFKISIKEALFYIDRAIEIFNLENSNYDLFSARVLKLKILLNDSASRKDFLSLLQVLFNEISSSNSALLNADYYSVMFDYCLKVGDLSKAINYQKCMYETKLELQHIRNELYFSKDNIIDTIIQKSDAITEWFSDKQNYIISIGTSNGIELINVLDIAYVIASPNVKIHLYNNLKNPFLTAESFKKVATKIHSVKSQTDFPFINEKNTLCNRIWIHHVIEKDTRKFVVLDVMGNVVNLQVADKPLRSIKKFLKEKNVFKTNKTVRM